MRPIADITYLARLSRLSFTEEERSALAKDLDDMIAFADDVSDENEMLALDEPIFRTESFVREDTVGQAWERDALLSSAATVAHGYVTVPKVLGEEAHD